MNRIQFVAAVFLYLAISGMAQNESPHPAPPKEKVVTGHATGTFEVKMTPQTAEEGTDPGIARMLLDKQIHGDLEGTSKGQMLATGSAQSSGAYVALERITGTLKGRAGSFVLQHSATMTRGMPQMSITVAPDSGTGQLTGLTGTFTIKIDSGKHSYDFEYTLPEAP
jgi:hypothetical protein